MPEVTFQANSRILGYRPGQIYRTEITRPIRALLERGVHLTLIDPPTLDKLYDDPPVVEEPPKKRRSRKKVEVEDNGSDESASDPEERGSVDREDYGYGDPESSGEREDRTPKYPWSRD